MSEINDRVADNGPWRPIKDNNENVVAGDGIDDVWLRVTISGDFPHREDEDIGWEMTRQIAARLNGQPIIIRKHDEIAEYDIARWIHELGRYIGEHGHELRDEMGSLRLALEFLQSDDPLQAIYWIGRADEIRRGYRAARKHAHGQLSRWLREYIHRRIYERISEPSPSGPFRLPSRALPATS